MTHLFIYLFIYSTIFYGIRTDVLRNKHCPKQSDTKNRSA